MRVETASHGYRIEYVNRHVMTKRSNPCSPWSTISYLLIVVSCFTGCGRRHATSEPTVTTEVFTTLNDSIAWRDLKHREAMTDGPRFEKLTAEKTGIDFKHRWDPPVRHAKQLDNAMAGGGVCIGDYDGDGLADIYLTRPQGGGRLYRNLGGFRFEDATYRAGVNDREAWSGGATFVDIDNDRDLDLYVCGYDTRNRLFVNQGDGNFRESAGEYGLDFRGASVMMAFADYDNDGDLDGYLVTNRLMPDRAIEGQITYQDGEWVVPPAARELMYVMVMPDGKPQMLMGGQYDHLYRNNGPGKKFTDVSDQAGITGTYYGLSATWWDYNEDGFPDLYVANDFYGPDHLYRNDGDGTFTDVAQELLPHTPWYSMGSDVADVNNDGRLDLMGSDMAGTTHFKAKVAMGEMDSFDNFFLTYPEPRQVMQNTLYLNSGSGRFLEIASLAGLQKTDWTWAVKFGDLDNDGHVDLYVSNGMTREWFNSDLRSKAEELGGLRTDAAWKMWIDSPQQTEANLAYRNQGDLKFASVGGEWGLDEVGVSFGAAFGDLDNDGDLDLVVNNFEGLVSVYRNQGSDGHRVMLQLIGKQTNSHGIGATVRAETTCGVQTRYLTLSRGFMSANEPVVHFGLGDQSTMDRLAIRWPGGTEQTFESLPADRFYQIRETNTSSPPRQEIESEPLLFVTGTIQSSARLKHEEQPYDDFARQPLLPNKLSQLGPGLAWGDVDSDGDDDLFVGGARGQAGTLLLQTGYGEFKPLPSPALEAAKSCEDMGALFFDAEGDGDIDLYVVSGGVESLPNDEALRDRLYLNDGASRLTIAGDGALPDVRDSGSVVAAADFDRDGDLDLFIGTRVIPGQYPLVPASRLLRNDSTTAPKFTDVTDQLAPQLQTSGLVTSAVWSDVDDDGWLDLLVSHEWGPVKLYHNQDGSFTDVTAEAGLDKLLGWWNGIAARDIDNDGDMDYAVTNFGLNTKYGAPSPENPIVIYYGDFDGSGTMRLVEAKRVEETLLPVRGKSCSQNAIPLVGTNFPTYRKFALASLSEIYTNDCLDSADRFEANTLASGVLINDGHGHFTFQPLPRIAQASPAFGVVFTEVDGDGYPDLYLVQNFFHPQPETPRMDGGMSLLLLGGGKPEGPKWQPFFPDRSGLVVTGDAKAVTTTDVNQDGLLDFVVSVNDDVVVTCERQQPERDLIQTIRLEAHGANRTAAGARVTVTLTDGIRQTAEVQAGGGYLSQSSSILAFGTGNGPGTRIERIEVRWPDGNRSSHKFDELFDQPYVIHQP